MKLHTYQKELFVVAIILCSTTILFSNTISNWVSTLAVYLTFQHIQISDRLHEKQVKAMKQNIDSSLLVVCAYKLQRFLIAKEIVWVVFFLMVHTYSAIIGAVLFTIYPLWRKLYRKYNPIKI